MLNSATTTCTILSDTVTECITDIDKILGYLGSISFGIAIIIGLMFLYFIGWIFNKLNSKKPWHY